MVEVPGGTGSQGTEARGTDVSNESAVAVQADSKGLRLPKFTYRSVILGALTGFIGTIIYAGVQRTREAFLNKNMEAMEAHMPKEYREIMEQSLADVDGQRWHKAFKAVHALFPEPHRIEERAIVALAIVSDEMHVLTQLPRFLANHSTEIREKINTLQHEFNANVELTPTMRLCKEAARLSIDRLPKKRNPSFNLALKLFPEGGQKVESVATYLGGQPEMSRKVKGALKHPEQLSKVRTEVLGKAKYPTLKGASATQEGLAASEVGILDSIPYIEELSHKEYVSFVRFFVNHEGQQDAFKTDKTLIQQFRTAFLSAQRLHYGDPAMQKALIDKQLVDAPGADLCQLQVFKSSSIEQTLVKQAQELGGTYYITEDNQRLVHLTWEKTGEKYTSLMADGKRIYTADPAVADVEELKNVNYAEVISGSET